MKCKPWTGKQGAKETLGKGLGKGSRVWEGLYSSLGFSNFASL